MCRHALSRLLFTGLLMAGSGWPLSGNVAWADAQLTGSALPPGINPSSPAGGNGGDAQGYDKKPIAPPAPGTEKNKTDSKATQSTPATQHTTTPSSVRKHPAQHKKNTVNKP